jgi:hypothetical protein
MIPLGNGVQFIARDEWGARAPRSRTNLFADITTFHWEGPGFGWPWPHETCYSLVRGIQRYHMDAKGWADIAYNWLACPHGFVFEGRGFNTRSAANGTNEGNGSAYAVCYLGGARDPLTDEGKFALEAAFLVSGASHHNGHRDWKPTSCPGDPVYAWQANGMPLPAPPLPPLVVEEFNALDGVRYYIHFQLDSHGNGYGDGPPMVGVPAGQPRFNGTHFDGTEADLQDLYDFKDMAWHSYMSDGKLRIEATGGKPGAIVSFEVVELVLAEAA